MSFVSAFHTGPLPEKPWRTGAVVCLLVSVIIGIMTGAVITMVVRYFETPETSSVYEFLALSAGAFLAYVAAIVLLFRAWPLEDIHEINETKLILLLAMVFSGMFLTYFAGRQIKGGIELKNPVVAMSIAVLTFQGVALLLVHFFLRQHHTGWAEGLGFDRNPSQSLLIGIGAGILVLYPVLRLNELCFHLFERLTLHPQEQQAVEILRQANTFLGRAVSFVGTVLIAPAGEEILFRGVLYPWAKRKFSQSAALWGTALLFGFIHVNLSSFIPLTLLAVILVLLYEYTGNLLAPIAVHCVFNGANFIALFYQQK